MKRLLLLIIVLAGSAAAAPSAALLTQLQTIENTTVSGFGAGPVLSADSSVLIVGAMTVPVGADSDGRVLVYTLSGGTFSLNDTLTPLPGLGGGCGSANAAVPLALSDNAEWLAVGCPDVWSPVGAVVVYNRGSDGFYTVDSTFYGNLTAAGQGGQYFGNSVSLSADGTLLSVSAIAGGLFNGSITFYTNSGSGFLEFQAAEIDDCGAEYGGRVGTTHCLRRDGDALSTTDSVADIGAVTSAGRAYTFDTNSTDYWACDEVHSPNTPIASGAFGESCAYTTQAYGPAANRELLVYGAEGNDVLHSFTESAAGVYTHTQAVGAPTGVEWGNSIAHAVPGVIMLTAGHDSNNGTLTAVYRNKGVWIATADQTVSGAGFGSSSVPAQFAFVAATATRTVVGAPAAATVIIYSQDVNDVFNSLNRTEDLNNCPYVGYPCARECGSGTCNETGTVWTCAAGTKEDSLCDDGNPTTTDVCNDNLICVNTGESDDETSYWIVGIGVGIIALAVVAVAATSSPSGY
jgi:hypothetical protein